MLYPCLFFSFFFSKAGNESKAKLFITLMLKTDELILSSLQSDVFGLEVTKSTFTRGWWSYRRCLCISFFAYSHSRYYNFFCSR